MKTLQERTKIRATDPLGLRPESAADALLRLMQGTRITDGETIHTFRHETQRHKSRLAAWKDIELDFEAKDRVSQEVVIKITTELI